MSKHFRIVSLVLLVAGIGIALNFTPAGALPPEELSREKLDRLIEANAIATADIKPRSYPGIYDPSGKYTPGPGRGTVEFRITTHLTEGQINALLAKNTVKIELPKTSTHAKIMDTLPTIIVLLLVADLVFYHINFGRGKSAHKVRNRPTVRFDDVARVDEAKSEVGKVIDFLREPQKHHRLGGNLPKGIVLIGQRHCADWICAVALAFAFATALLMPSGRAAEPSERKPNIIFILIDDFGWSDLGCYGSRFYQTPSLDRMAAEGMRFTDAYAACPVCSPTRASTMTGKYPARLHLTDWLPGRRDMPSQRLLRPAIRQELPLSETTIAESLKQQGYVSASIGKWHLGAKGFEPEKQGFDHNIAGDHTGTPLSYFYPFRRQDAVMPGLENGQEGEYLTDRLTTEAEKFIEQNRARPFLLYLPHYAVPIPLKAKAETVSRYEGRAEAGQAHTNAIYAAMIQSMDESVGRIMRQLEALNLTEHTAIFLRRIMAGSR